MARLNREGDPAAPLSARWRLPDGLSRRTIAIGITLLLELLILLVLLSLSAGRGRGPDAAATLTTFDTAGDPAQSDTPEQEQQESEASDAPAQPLQIQPQANAPASPLVLPPPALQRPPSTLTIPPPPAQPQATPSPAPSRTGRIRAVVRSGGASGPPDTGRPGPPDDQIVGTAPDGSPLYAARWYREPYPGELSGYLSTARGPSWGLIACRTAPDWRVEDCEIVGESPPGSNIARAAQAAAWQFQVRPPRVGGEYLVGAWVRIRLDYTNAPPR